MVFNLLLFLSFHLEAQQVQNLINEHIEIHKNDPTHIKIKSIPFYIYSKKWDSSEIKSES